MAAALVIMLSYGYVSWQYQGVDDQINIAKSKGDILKSELDRYNAQLRKLKPDANKLAAQARLEKEVQAKRDSLTAVGKYDDSQRSGYSGVMTSLAKLSNDNISISDIHIAQEQLDIKGLARTPRAVPDWVVQFKSEVSLVGRTFDDVAIGRNEKGMVTFELSTRKETQQ
jgi:MSHA biogenesis protein MshI